MHHELNVSQERSIPSPWDGRFSMPCNVDTDVQYLRSSHFAVASESDGKAGTVPVPRPILTQTPQYFLYKNSHKFGTFQVGK